MKTAIDTADELATKYAQCIWWTRIPILSRRDPRLGEGKTAPAAGAKSVRKSTPSSPTTRAPTSPQPKPHQPTSKTYTPRTGTRSSTRHTSQSESPAAGGHAGETSPKAKPSI